MTTWKGVQGARGLARLRETRSLEPVDDRAPKGTGFGSSVLEHTNGASSSASYLRTAHVEALRVGPPGFEPDGKQTRKKDSS
jgi:hypothetical protein